MAVVSSHRSDLIKGIRTDLRFSSPIGRLQLAPVAQRSGELCEAVLELRAQGESLQRSNRGGWHSDNLLMSSDPLFQWLATEIRNGAIAITSRLLGRIRAAEVEFVKMWANVNEVGDWNTPHDHTTTWSGALYVADGLGGDGAGGEIVFWNPVNNAQTLGFAGSVSYQPRVGEMMLFPGYLLHAVAPHQWQTSRVSFAFDFNHPHQLIV